MLRTVSSVAGAILLSCAMQSGVANAADWAQYRGPTHDGISSESVKLPWPAAGPKVIWKVPTTNGFSSFAVGGGLAVTQVSRDVSGTSREFCVALDAANGKELWAVDLDPAKYGGGGNSGTKDNGGGDGPRSTPAVSDGLVYVYSSDLVLSCLDGKTGAKVWAIDMVKEHGGHNISWSNASSPIIDGDLLFVAAGGSGESMLALKKKTGDVVWKTGSETITHASPVVDTILGVRQVLFYVQHAVISLSIDSGKELWRYKFDYATSTAASPLVCGDIVYCSAGYGVGGGACKITKDGANFAATQIWRIKGNDGVANHWSTPVYKDGYLYGMFSFKKYGVGPLKCVEVATGKVIWQQPGFGAGNVTLAKNALLALADSGELVAVNPNPAAYKEICRFKAVEGKCWSTPILSDGRVYLRSTKEGTCLDLSGK